MICVLDCRHYKQHLLQLSLIPIDRSLKYNGPIFDNYIKPEGEVLNELMKSEDKGKVYGIKNFVERGMPQSEFLDLFEYWWENTFNRKIIPIVFNYKPKIYPLMELFGYDLYFLYFSSQYVDVLCIKQFIMDRSIKNPFSFYKTESILNMAQAFGIEHERSFDSLYLAHMIHKVYEKVVKYDSW